MNSENIFNGAAHVQQLLTLLPNVDANKNESNLKVGKGISNYMKITEQFIPEEQRKPAVKNIIKSYVKKTYL